jgi:hypothetical protein
LCEQIKGVAGAGLSANSHSIQSSAPEQNRIGTEGAGFENVSATAHAAVEQQRQLAFGHGGNRRQAVDAGGNAVQLPTAMVAHHQPIEAQRNGFLGICRVQHPCELQPLWPAVAQASEGIPVEPGVHVRTDEMGGTFDVALLGR